jgi:hypothetical protein
MNSGQVKIWKEATVAYFKSLFHISPEETEYSYENPHNSQVSPEDKLPSH